MQVDHIPVVVTEIPFLGDGPSVGIGAAADDPFWMQQEMITGQVLVQFTRAPAYPWSPKVQEFAGPVLYPGAQTRQVTIGQSQQALPGWLLSQYQDAQSTVPFSTDNTPPPDVALGAPGVPTGIPFIGRA